MGILNILPPALLKTKLFEGLEQPELKALVNKSELKSYGQGDVVVKEGDEGDSFYCVISGAVDIVIASAAANDPVTIATLQEGGVVGEMVLVKKNLRSASALAAKKSELLCWHYSQCLDLFSSNPVLGYKVMRNLAYLVANKLTDMNVLYKVKQS
ncbi:MAG: cyclic nucleotide-binding domain-containing protein [Bdellovibrionota bacterium]